VAQARQSRRRRPARHRASKRGDCHLPHHSSSQNLPNRSVNSVSLRPGGNAGRRRTSGEADTLQKGETRHWDQDSVSKEVAFCGAMADKWEEIRRIVDHVAEINKEIAFCAAEAAQLEDIEFPFTDPWDPDSVRKEVASCDAMAEKWEGLKRIADHVAEIKKEITFCRAKAACQLEEITGAKAAQLEEFAFCGAKAAQLEDI
jgi:hypothetical protein